MRRHTHQITFSSGQVRKRFTSWASGEADREWKCLTLLDEHAPGLAPTPLERTVEDGAPVIVMERIPGTPLDLVPLTAVQNSELGASLRRLYEVPLGAIVRCGLTERRLGPLSLLQHVQEAFRHAPDLSNISNHGVIEAAIAESAEFLSELTQPSKVPLPVMGIADLNPANVLWDGQGCRLVDFEDGGRTSPEFELADHVEHIASRTNHVYDARQLPCAVGLTDTQLRSHGKYRTLWAMFWLHALLPGNGAYLRNPVGATESQARHVLELLADYPAPA